MKQQLSLCDGNFTLPVEILLMVTGGVSGVGLALPFFSLTLPSDVMSDLLALASLFLCSSTPYRFSRTRLLGLNQLSFVYIDLGFSLDFMLQLV